MPPVPGQAPRRMIARLNYVRVGLAVAHLFFPGLMPHWLVSRPIDRRARTIIRLLGFRQLSQALLTGARPTAAVLLLGAEVDIAHAASMTGLALCSRRWCRAALVNAVIAAAFAFLEVIAARTDSQPVAPIGWSATRDHWADRVAGALVPHRFGHIANADAPRGGPHA